MYVYIKEMTNEEELVEGVDKPEFIKKIIVKYKKIFNKVTIRKIDISHFLYIIPKARNVEDIRKIIDNKSINNQNIILSKSLKKYENELNLKNNFTNLFICDIIGSTTEKIEMQNVYILVNEYNDSNLELIKYLIDRFKLVSIVTNNIKNYHKFEQEEYDNNGVLIVVTNNKNKALKNANIIINLDYNNEDINRYRIKKDSVIINCTTNKVVIKYFQGIIINNIEIDVNKKQDYELLYNDFDLLDLYVSFELKGLKYEEISKKKKSDKAKIKNLIGSNGFIDKKDYEIFMKNIDKI